MTQGSGNSVPGRPSGFTITNKFGINEDIDTTTTPETIWSHGGTFPFLDVGIAMDLVSTSPNDTLAGSGAQIVRVTHYATDNTESVVEYDMAGLSRVPISDDVKIGTRIEVVQSGASMSNEGEINLVDRATGLVVYQSVEIGEGQTLSAVQICPKGKEGIVRKHTVRFAKTQSPAGSADLKFKLRQANGTILNKHPAVISTTKEKDEYEYPDGSGIEMVAGDIVYWECVTVSSNDTPIEGRFDVEFFDAQ
jgi:hypothetical protein